MARGAQRVLLETERIRVEVLPELGGRVQSLTDASTGRQWLWHNETVPIGPSSIGANYDENWQGGFEELFPNDAATILEGVELPDHGELWSTAWDVVEAADSQLVLRTTGPVTGAGLTKSFTVDGPELVVRYRLENPSQVDLPFLFKLHAAIAVDSWSSIELPGGSVEPVDASFSGILPGPGPWPWPGPDGHELSECRDRSADLREFVYVHDLPEGWCAVSDRRLGARLRLSYPLADFPYCWLFITYGGWRDHQVVVLEPCTNYPKDLHEAIARGSSGVLPGGGSVSMSATFRVEQA